MKARLVDLTFTIDGKQRLTVELEKGHRNDFRQKFEELQEHDVRVKVTRWRKRRSLDANAYMWVLVDKIAEAMVVSKEEVYRNAIRNIGGVSDVIAVRDSAVEKFRKSWEEQGLGWQSEIMDSQDGYKRVIVYYGSRSYDTKQMFALIDNLIQDAQALGIETATPEELAKMKGLLDDESTETGTEAREG